MLRLLIAGWVGLTLCQSSKLLYLSLILPRKEPITADRVFFIILSEEQTLNIVFDLGGVVFTWQPTAIIESVADDPDVQNLLRKEIFQHSDWLELDRGTITLESAIDRGSVRTGLPRKEVERVFNAVPRFLTPITQSIDLICELRKSGNRLFVLSNMHLASIAYLEEKHDIWGLFDGIVISSRVQMVKPEPRIYEYLLKKYDLAAAETVFIDDTPENLAAASAAGIETIRFVDAAQCGRALNFACRE